MATKGALPVVLSLERPEKRRVGPRPGLQVLEELLWSQARLPLQGKECRREQGRDRLSH